MNTNSEMKQFIKENRKIIYPLWATFGIVFLLVSVSGILAFIGFFVWNFYFSAKIEHKLKEYRNVTFFDRGYIFVLMPFVMGIVYNVTIIIINNALNLHLYDNIHW